MEKHKNKFFPDYNICKQLRDKDFNEPCFSCYNLRTGFCYPVKWQQEQDDCYLLAPLYQQITDWFRDKHNINIMVEKTIGGGSGVSEVYVGHLYKLDMEPSDFHKYTKCVYDTYYEALNKTIEEVLKLI